jgi:hypothetical protein|tara:strand:+ start:420 stop:881 length:462 start_codon:yes stop_codon:yes gene_type:complete
VSEEQENILVEDYTELTICDIKEEWDWVKIGLEEINARDPDPKQIPEDIYAACKYGLAKLFTMGNKELFVVLSEVPETDTDINLSIWYFWVKPEYRGSKKARDFFPGLTKYAKNNGYKSIQFETVCFELAEYAVRDFGYYIDTIVVRNNLNGK